jgi:inorganic pyrophosphatase
LVNLWRHIPPGDNPPEVVNAVIEVVSRSRDKYEYHEEWEAFVLDRVLHSSIVFPVDYGFIPQTWYNDNDPLDIMIVSYEPFEVGCIVTVKPIGVLLMEDEAGDDRKILSVPVKDPPRKWVDLKAWKDVGEATKLITYAIELYKERFP